MKNKTKEKFTQPIKISPLVKGGKAIQKAKGKPVGKPKRSK